MGSVLGVLGLTCCVLLVLRAGTRPYLVAAGYALLNGIAGLALGAPWLASLVAVLVTFALTFVYLAVLELLDGAKFWLWLASGVLVLVLIARTIELLCVVLGIHE